MITPLYRRASLLAAALTALIVGSACQSAGGSEVRRAAAKELAPAEGVSLEEPPGSAAAPYAIEGLPFTHAGNTAADGESRLPFYRCAPALKTPGPEIHYRVSVVKTALLRVRLKAGVGAEVGAVLLRDPELTCLTRGRTGLARTVEPGDYRIIVDSHGAPGPFVLDVSLEAVRPEVLGRVWNTYYYLANEVDRSHGPYGTRGGASTPLLDSDCTIIADVGKAFHDDLCIEGSGVLADGRVVNYSSSCTKTCFAADPCGRYRYKICYRELDVDEYPWGMGAQGRVLEPDVSIAVDRRQVPLGTVLYLPELDGAIAPGRTEPHDGCVRADDVGGAIKGDHIDIFSGTRARWKAWEAIFPTRSWFTLIRHHPRCAHLPGAPQ